MGQMFCTLEQAASRLGVSEPELKGMVAEGVLREFRDGASLLLQTSEVDTLAASRDRDTPQQRPPQTAAPAKAAARRTDETPPGAGEPAEDLTGSEASKSAAPARRTTSKKRTAAHRGPGASPASPASKDRELEEVLTPACEPTACLPPYPVPVSAPWPGLQIDRPSAWRRLWTGVTQDRPGAVVALCAVLGAVLAAITISIYLLL